jgi:hypothetical protein
MSCLRLFCWILILTEKLVGLILKIYRCSVHRIWRPSDIFFDFVIVDVVITIGDLQLQSCITNWCTSWLHIYTYFLVVLPSIGEYVSYPIGADLFVNVVWFH